MKGKKERKPTLVPLETNIRNCLQGIMAGLLGGGWRARKFTKAIPDLKCCTVRREIMRGRRFHLTGSGPISGLGGNSSRQHKNVFFLAGLRSHVLTLHRNRLTLAMTSATWNRTLRSTEGGLQPVSNWNRRRAIFDAGFSGSLAGWWPGDGCLLVLGTSHIQNNGSWGPPR